MNLENFSHVNFFSNISNSETFRKISKIFQKKVKIVSYSEIFKKIEILENS
mgnify:CR=1 FL=1